ncbi:thioredoxin trx1, partial [Coemansia sp. RSA 2399]
KLSTEFGDKVTFIKVDVDEGAEIAGTVGVRAMPTFKFFLNGEQVEDLEVVGADKATLRTNIEKLAALGDEPAKEEKPAEEDKPAEEENPEETA